LLLRCMIVPFGPGAFVIPNPWDIGTAPTPMHSSCFWPKLGFKALATTSAGYAFFARPAGDGGVATTSAGYRSTR
jgi:2-methylisocitrate lyase-like PEP mutase family enzyme